ncbi:MAG: hypothetical protein IPJ13_10195 [Saprospiraceae bacterium]|nr:hypothetical protein [Saprospiraceae bacterium]
MVPLLTGTGDMDRYTRAIGSVCTEIRSMILVLLQLWPVGKIPTTYDDASAVAGTTYHYWVRAGSDNAGANISAFSTGDTGFRASAPGTVTIPVNVQASDGTFSDR